MSVRVAGWLGHVLVSFPSTNSSSIEKCSFKGVLIFAQNPLELTYSLFSTLPLLSLSSSHCQVVQPPPQLPTVSPLLFFPRGIPWRRPSARHQAAGGAGALDPQHPGLGALPRLPGYAPNTSRPRVGLHTRAQDSAAWPGLDHGGSPRSGQTRAGTAQETASTPSRTSYDTP
jgi:hypothetical protein